MLVILAVLTAAMITPGILEYRKQFNEWIVKALIQKFLHPSLDFIANQGLSEKVFYLSGLYSSAERYNSEDKFIGRIGSTVFEFSEITADESHVSSGDSGHSDPIWHRKY